MGIVSGILGAAGLGSLAIMLLILARFGHKLGAVTKMKPYYRGYYAAIGLVAAAFVTRFIRVSVFWAPPDMIPAVLNDPIFYLAAYHLPLALGLSIGLFVTWRYWSWLLKER
ncbi:MAG TPA: hypothetical protein ENJ31_06850 [Anaerolineae bacterium]|nr:hypothetical protein [Anaerolineae bacterium]